METTNHQHRLDYQRIERVLIWIDEHWQQQPGVDDLARIAGLSTSHFHRLFKRFAGITPKAMIEFLTADAARRRLMDSASVLDAALDSGLSGASRLHDLMVTVDAATPGEIQRSGEGMRIDFGVVDSPFGPCLLGLTGRGVCTLEFLSDHSEDDGAQVIQARWPRAQLHINRDRAKASLAQIVAGLRSRESPPRLDIRGSNFQLRVWDALLRIPPGRMISYGEIARALGQPRASRAVGTAVGANPVPLLIPCHRVLRRSGAFGQYSGGVWRKRAILLWEQGQVER
jgi:AraC family transcriptional regulator of adaptative response/methylated-DNA-[protein]-cysteine methyltransferase